MVARRQWSRWSEEDRREAVALYEQGKTIREIAEWFGRPNGSTWNVLQRSGVAMRAPGINGSSKRREGSK